MPLISKLLTLEEAQAKEDKKRGQPTFRIFLRRSSEADLKQQLDFTNVVSEGDNSRKEIVNFDSFF